MEEDVFFRVLYTGDHFRAYRHGKVTSHHHGQIPGPWQHKWYVNQNREFVDRDRRTVAGIYSKRALDAFLEIAPLRQHPNDWRDIEIARVSELEGLCAYRTPEDAFVWGQRGAYAMLNKNRYIEFFGEYLCDDPDAEGGNAVQARFDRWVSPLPRLQTAQEFCQNHELVWIAPTRR